MTWDLKFEKFFRPISRKLSQLGELAARKYAEDNGLKFVSPYNDYEVIAGQVGSQNLGVY